MTNEEMLLICVFGSGALLAAFILFMLTRTSNRRTDLASRRQEEELLRYGASHTLAGMQKTFILGGLGTGALVFIISYNVVFTLFPIFFGFLIPALYPWWVKRHYLSKFEEGFSECLEIWTRCLQAGLSLQQAVTAASQDLRGPAAMEMSLLAKELGLGDIESALWRFATRMPTEDVRYAVLGVITCRQTGGRISEVVANIARSIRERAAQRDRIKAITSMGRTEAYIMAVMPAGIGFMMYLLEPSTMQMLFGTLIGVIGTLIAIAWESLGLFIIWKIVDVKG